MSGWIKFEKDLRGDIRVKRMARQLIERGVVTHMRFRDTLAVTTVLGGLAQLWMHGDTFARDDDTLEISAAEIDEIAGIEGFSEILPTDWLEIVEPDRVKLPGFQAHNGPEAKKTALTGKRVSNYRARHRNATPLRPAKACNGGSLPDQTRLDQTIQDKTLRERAPRAARQAPAHFTVTNEMREWAQENCPEVDVDGETARFRDHEFAQPHSNWPAAWRNWLRRCGQFGPTPSRNGHALHRGKSLAELEDLEIRRLLADGRSAEQVADEVQVPVARVHAIIGL